MLASIWSSELTSPPLIFQIINIDIIFYLLIFSHEVRAWHMLFRLFLSTTLQKTLAQRSRVTYPRTQRIKRYNPALSDSKGNILITTPLGKNDTPIHTHFLCSDQLHPTVDTCKLCSFVGMGGVSEKYLMDWKTKSYGKEKKGQHWGEGHDVEWEGKFHLCKLFSIIKTIIWQNSGLMNILLSTQMRLSKENKKLTGRHVIPVGLTLKPEQIFRYH